MMWDLPIAVTINGADYKIRNKCDYRIILDVISTLTDEEFEMQERVKCALFIFYEDLTGCSDIETAVKEMMKIINNGEEVKEDQENKPKIMDWKHDFSLIAPPVSRVLGYSVRDSKNYTHWFDFIGAYMEIGSDCTFANIISIRNKRMKGKKLEKWEQEFYNEHREEINLPQKLSAEEEEFLNAEY